MIRVVIADDHAMFRAGLRALLGAEDDPAPRAAVVVSARPHGDRLLVRFDLAADREAAAELTGLLAEVPVSDMAPLEPGSYYPHQLVGLAVRTVAGELVGRVTDVLETGGSAEVLEVRTEGGRVHLVPLIAQVIADVDLDAGQVTITPLPGLLE